MQIAARTSVDPYSVPTAALRRLNLPAAVPKDFSDLVRLGSSDMSIATRELNTSREALETSFNRASEAVGHLRVMEGTLTEIQKLVKGNTTIGTSPATRRQNQKRITELLGEIDNTIKTAKHNGTLLFDGNMTVGQAGDSTTIPRLSLDRMGTITAGGKTFNLEDLARRGSLDTTHRKRTVSAAAQSVAGEALKEVEALREKLGDLGQNTIRPRIGDMAEVLAALYTRTASSRPTVESLLQLRNLTLQGTGVAAAVGATDWDPKRVEDLLK